MEMKMEVEKTENYENCQQTEKSRHFEDNDKIVEIQTNKRLFQRIKIRPVSTRIKQPS